MEEKVLKKQPSKALVKTRYMVQLNLFNLNLHNIHLPRALVTTLQNLLALPSISSSISGDVLPEAVLIRNILEEMLASLVTLASLCHKLADPQVTSEKFQQSMPSKILPKIIRFQQVFILYANNFSLISISSF